MCTFFVTWQSTCTAGVTLMIALENGLEKKKILYISFGEDTGVLQGKLKIKQRAAKRKSAVTLEGFIWHESFSHIGAQDDLCDLAI